jgi:hypothetical protein
MAITLKEAYGLNGCGADLIRSASNFELGPATHDWDNLAMFGGLQIGQDYQVVVGGVQYLVGSATGFTIREYDYLSNTAGRAWNVATDGTLSNIVLTITKATKGTLLLYNGIAGQTTGNKTKFRNCSLYSLGATSGNLLPNSGGIYYDSVFNTVSGVSSTYQNAGDTGVPEIKIVSAGEHADAGIYYRTGNTTVYNQLICQADHTYNVSFWAFSNKTGTSTFLNPLIEGQSTIHGSSLSVPNGVWTKVWCTATITKACNTVIVLTGLPLNANTTFYIKDVRVTRCTPEDTYWMAWIPSSNGAEQNERLPDIATVNTLLDLHQNARSTYPFQNSLLNSPQTSLSWPRGVNPVTGIQILSNTSSTENYSYSSYFTIPANTKFYLSFWAQCSTNLKGADVYILPDDYVNKGLVVKDQLPLNQTYTLYRYEFTSPSTWGDNVPVRIRFDNNGSNNGAESRVYLKDVNISLDIDHSNELASWEGFKYQISSRTRTIDTTEWSYSGNVRTKGTLNQQKILYSDGSASDWTTLTSNSQSETAQYTDYGAWTYSDPKRTRTVTYRWSDGATNPGGTQTQTATTSTNYSAWTYSSDNSYRTRTATPVYTYTDTTRYGTATSQRENGTVSYGTWSYSGITRTRTVSYVYSDVTKTSNSQSETATLNSIVGEYTSSNPYNGNNQWTKAGGGTISVAVLGKYNFSDNVAAQQYVTNSCTYSYTNNSVGTWNASSHVMTISSAGTTIVGDSSANTLTITYSGKTISVVFKRQANAITGYGTPTGGTLTATAIPASGGTINSGTVGGTVSQTRTFTSGATDVYSVSTPTGGTFNSVTAPSLGTTIKNSTVVGTLTYTYTLNGKTGTIGTTIAQQGNFVVGLAITGGALSYNTIAAKGGDGLPTVSTQTATYTFTSGSTSTTTPSSTYGTYSFSVVYSWETTAQNGFTLHTDSSGKTTGVVIAPSYGITIGNARSSGTIVRTGTGTWTPTSGYNSQGVKTATTVLTATCTQALNKVVSATITKAATLSYSTVIPAGGGTSSPTTNSSCIWTYSSGAQNVPSGHTASVSYSMVAGNGFTINTSNGIVTASSRGVTPGAARSSNTITHTVKYSYTNPSSVGGETVSATTTSPGTTCSQAANHYSDDSMKLHFGSWTGTNTASVGAGSSTTAMYLEVTRLYSSGDYQSGHNVTTRGTFTVSGTGFSISGSNVIAASRGTTIGAARSGTVTGKYNALTATGTITQAENKITNSDYNASNSQWSVGAAIGSGMTAAGGSATITRSASHLHTNYRFYSSGSTDGPFEDTVVDNVNLSIVSNGNNRFSLSGTTLTHSNMGTNAVTDTVTVRATNVSNASTYRDVSASVTNSRVSYKGFIIDTYSYPTMSYSGGTYSPLVSGRCTAVYASGSEGRYNDFPSNATLAYSFEAPVSGLSINSTTGVITATANSSTSSRTAWAMLRVYYGGELQVGHNIKVTQSGAPGPTRVNISINNPQLSGGEVVITFSPACYDSLTILVMGYLQDGSLYSVYRNVGGSITEDRFYPNGATADSASIENVDGEAVPPVTKTRGIYYW